MATDRKAQFSDMLQKLKGPKGFLVALIALLVIRVLLLLKEVGTGTYMVPEPRSYVPAPQLTEDSATYNDVKDLLKEKEPFSASAYVGLGNLNVFDWKGITQQEALDRQINAKYVEAQELLRRNTPESLQQALTAINEALRISPSHQRSNDLKREIESVLGQASAATGSATTTTTLSN